MTLSGEVEHADGLVTRAQRFIEAGRPADAEQAFAAATREYAGIANALDDDVHYTLVLARFVATLLDRAHNLLAMGKCDEAGLWLRNATPYAEALDSPLLTVGLYDAHTAVSITRGDDISALSWARKAVEAGAGQEPHVRAPAMINLALLCMSLGLDEVWTVVDDAVEIARGAAEPGLLTQALAARAAVQVRRGNPEKALGDLEALESLAAAPVGRVGGDIERIAGLAAAALGDQTRAAQRLSRSARTAEAAGDALGAGRSHLLIAMLPESSAQAVGEHMSRARQLLSDSPENLAIADYLLGLRLLMDYPDDPGQVANAAALILPAALAIDAWRVGLGSSALRDQWASAEQSPSAAVSTALNLLWRMRQPVLLIALIVHLAQSATPVGQEVLGVGLPPAADLSAWFGAGVDPLGPACAEARTRYGRPVRDGEGAPNRRRPPAERAHQPSGVSSDDEFIDVVYVHRRHLYVAWRGPDGPVAVERVENPDAVQEAVQAWRAATPGGPGGPWGVFDSPEREEALAKALGSVLLPDDLREYLLGLAVGSGKRRPLLRVRATGDLATVPFELLYLGDGPTGEGLRLLDVVGVVVAVPDGVRHRAPVPLQTALPGGGRVMVLDPRVPGFPAASALGSVLGRPERTGPLLERFGGYLADPSTAPAAHRPVDLFRRQDVGRDWLRSALRMRPASGTPAAAVNRLLYVGHVSTIAYIDGGPSTTGLHLSDTAEVPGLAEAIGRHRPLGVRDLLDDEHEGWVFPARVALIACASGTDASARDGIGLAHAMVRLGAAQVIATRWPLPTGQAFADAAGLDDAAPGAVGGDAGNPLLGVVLAVDEAQVSADAPRELVAWQRERLRAWRETGALADSPVLWAGIQMSLAPPG